MKMKDFAYNMNFHGPPKSIKGAMAASLGKLFEYPDPSQEEMKSFCAEHYGVTSEALSFGAGATEIIFTLARLLSDRPVLVPTPSFWEYEEANVRSGNMDLSFLELAHEDEFRLDLNEMSMRLKKGGVAYLCQPNNPTSKRIPADQLRDFISSHPEVDFVVDETYLLFSNDFDEASLVKFAAQEVDNLFVVQSFSKFFAVPGLRMGVLAAAPNRIDEYESIRTLYTTSSLMPLVLRTALSDKAYIDSSRNAYTRSINTILSFADHTLDKEYFRPVKPEGPYMLIQLLEEVRASALAISANKSNLDVRDCSEMRGLGEEWIRVAIRGEEDMGLLFQGLNEIIETSN